METPELKPFMFYHEPSLVHGPIFHSEGGGGLDVDGPALVHVDGGDGRLDIFLGLSGGQALVLLASTVHLQVTGSAHSKGLFF